MAAPLLPWLRQEHFLPPEEHQALLDWTLENESRFVPAALAGNIVDPKVRRASSLRDLGPLEPLLEARIAAAVPGWIAQLRITGFEISDIELEIAAHNDGAHFTLHSDTFTRDKQSRGDRMLSAVYYYHREPRGFEGGYLRLHRLGARPGDEGVDVAPEQNSLIVFPSWAPHEVLPIACPSGDFADSRFAVNCWVYRARI
jgi:SM-20-related protein